MQITKTATIAVITASLLAAGCVTNPSQPRQQASSNVGECNMGLAAGAGALLGGLIAKGNDRLRGAALGAALGAGACLAWDYHAKQTKTATQVQDEYRRANRGALPDESRVTFYDTRVSPAQRIAPGDQVIVVSDIEIVQGSRDYLAPQLEEEVVIVRPDGQEIRARKQANQGSYAGGYRTSYTLRMPEGVQPGVYPVRTSLYLNGRPVETRRAEIQVVDAGTGRIAS